MVSQGKAKRKKAKGGGLLPLLVLPSLDLIYTAEGPCCSRTSIARTTPGRRLQESHPWRQLDSAPNVASD
jgi:hypothetical protein